MVDATLVGKGKTQSRELDAARKTKDNNTNKITCGVISIPKRRADELNEAEHVRHDGRVLNQSEDSPARVKNLQNQCKIQGKI